LAAEEKIGKDDLFLLTGRRRTRLGFGGSASQMTKPGLRSDVAIWARDRAGELFWNNGAGETFHGIQSGGCYGFVH
jgi:hypothetical protein